MKKEPVKFAAEKERLRMLNQHLSISPAVQEALAQGKPVVALESTIISHGMPYPQRP